MDTAQTVEAPASSAVTVTAQTMAQFYDNPPPEVVVRLNEGIADEPKDEPKEAKKANGADAVVDTVVPEDDEPDDIKSNPKLKDRFSELTSKRKAAEKAAHDASEQRETERQARQQAELERDALRAKYEPPKTTIGPKPARDQFIADSDYESAMELWVTDKVRFEDNQKKSAADAKAHQEQVEKSFKASVESAKAAIADWDEVITKSTVLLSNEAVNAIREDDNGGLIMYHFAQNPDAAEKLTKMTVPAMNREIGRLSAKLERPAEQAKPAQALATISKAPAPISPARGVAAGSASYDTSKMSFQQYSALRDAGKIK